MKYIIIFFIKIYQVGISPIVGGKCACRFYPSCSDYAVDAVRKYGVWRGGWMAVRRILRCRPGGGSGVDEVR
ncbi:MAG: membrane protein insertion efficiency factor YidD [Rickettsiales bacterium]|jgi:putative membrane protein insertion efficiency factor|nr:membrane protein insertion efficiency factor YidD [Rickettsiales bacterium]